jgi:hypothetical protein
MALTVAGTRAPPSYCASFRAARMLAAISRTRFRPSSTMPATRPASHPHARIPIICCRDALLAYSAPFLFLKFLLQFFEHGRPFRLLAGEKTLQVGKSADLARVIEETAHFQASKQCILS